MDKKVSNYPNTEHSENKEGMSGASKDIGARTTNMLITSLCDSHHQYSSSLNSVSCSSIAILNPTPLRILISLYSAWSDYANKTRDLLKGIPDDTESIYWASELHDDYKTTKN